MNLLSRLFRPSPPRVIEFHDPAIGLLTYDAEDEAWTKVLETQPGQVRLSIGGDHEPNEVLRRHAAQIESELPQLLSELPAFLERSAQETPALAAEIGNLAVEEIALWWDKEPEVAMVWLRGGTEGRIWHCTYGRGHLGALAFDD